MGLNPGAKVHALLLGKPLGPCGIRRRKFWCSSKRIKQSGNDMWVEGATSSCCMCGRHSAQPPRTRETGREEGRWTRGGEVLISDLEQPSDHSPLATGSFYKPKKKKKIVQGTWTLQASRLKSQDHVLIVWPWAKPWGQQSSASSGAWIGACVEA